jgi:DNA-binding transcriptional regulator LsrR (DeoR family)
MYSRLEMVGLAADLSFDIAFSQEVMSDALGLSAPHLNRSLAKLRAEGVVAISNHRVFLRDVVALEMLASFQPLDLTRIPATEPHGRRAELPSEALWAK